MADADIDEGCEICAGMELVLIRKALEYRANGWELEHDHDEFCGSWLSCEGCGRGFDEDPAVEAFETGMVPEGWEL